jgi:hypothetical protein
LLLPLSLFSGCASVPQSASTQILEQTAITVAVGEVVLSSKTPAAQQATAQQIKSIASQVQAVLNGQTTTIAALQAFVVQKMAELKLNPQEQLLANVLISTIMQELNGKIGAGVLAPTDLVVVNQLLGWVEAAAVPYGAT